MRSNGAASQDGTPLVFLKALGPIARADVLSFFIESSPNGVVPGIWKKPARHVGYLLLPTCQLYITRYQDNKKNGTQICREQNVALRGTVKLPKASLYEGFRAANPQMRPMVLFDFKKAFG